MKTDLGPIEQRLQQANHTSPASADVLLARINNALDRLDRGQFGYCKACGDAISIERLEGDPCTDTCGACESDD